MSLTKTQQIPLGYNAPAFNLLDVRDNEFKSLGNLRGDKATIIAFICNHCPYVKHIIDGLVTLANDYKNKGVALIAINSNDFTKYTEDAPDKMQVWANALNFPFSYLVDESQEIAKAYFAECTPDFSVFDQNLECIYRGRMDAATPGNDNPVDAQDLRTVLDVHLTTGKIVQEQLPSMGCNIKWK